jgi:prepilin-type N-terminal cleavage/methylation domain-containing protein
VHTKRTDNGLSLIELIITVAIMGIAFVALIGGMTSSFVAAGTHRKQAIAETYVRQYAEKLKASVYVGGTGSSVYAAPSPASFVPPLGTAFAVDDPNVLSETCLPSSSTNCTQIIEIRVRSSDASEVVSEKLQLVKRR